MKIITKHYSGEQDGYLYPRAQEIGGVSGDSDACKIYFKLPKQFEIGWGKMIAFDGELYDPITKQYIPIEYPLASDNSFTIPSEITDQYRGKTINYHLVLNEIGTSTVILSQSSTLYFSKTAKNTNVVTYLATHAFVDADYAIDEAKDRPSLRFFRMEGNPDVKLTLDVPYLDSDGKIPRQFIDVDKYSVNVFDVANQDQLVTLKDAMVGDWGRIVTNGPFKGQMFMLTGKYNVADDWVLIYTDTPLFTDVRTNGLTVLTGANLDYINGKALCTNSDGDIVGSDTTSDELKQLHGVKTDKTVQEQLDGKVNVLGSPAPGIITYHIPYDFSQVVNPEYIQLKLNTVTLDNHETQIEFAEARHRLNAADIANDKSGLYTKALADAKLNVPGTVPGNPSEVLRLPYFFEQVVGSDKVTVKSHTIKLDNSSPKVDEVFTMDVAIADIAGNKAGLYNKALADQKITLLGKEPYSGEEYHIPFNINPLVQNANTISTSFDTITLDNKKTVKSYPMAIPSADVSADKAGLYNKILADAKQDKIDAVDATIPTTGWASEGDFFVVDVAVAGLKSTHNPIVGAVFDGSSPAIIEAQMEAANHILKADPLDGKIKFYADVVIQTAVPIVVRLM